jgi:hypothetical protein
LVTLETGRHGKRQRVAGSKATARTREYERASKGAVGRRLSAVFAPAGSMAPRLQACMVSREVFEMQPTVTLLDLVTAVSEYARNDGELIATVVWLVNSGTVRLGGNFRGARFDVTSERHAA